MHVTLRHCVKIAGVSCLKLTMSLVNNALNITNTLLFFADAKDSHILSIKKITVYLLMSPAFT